MAEVATFTPNTNHHVLAINPKSSGCVLQRNSYCNLKSDILMGYADQLRL